MHSTRAGCKRAGRARLRHVVECRAHRMGILRRVVSHKVVKVLLNGRVGEPLGFLVVGLGIALVGADRTSAGSSSEQVHTVIVEQAGAVAPGVRATLDAPT